MDVYRRPDTLLDDAALTGSVVVANSAMNRERQLAGVNSYAAELGFDPLEFIIDRLAEEGRTAVGWLDLCCGNGRALAQASIRLHDAGLSDRVAVVGVDLVDFFERPRNPLACLELVCAAVPDWSPARAFDLITCVHGLHYVGDKLAVLANAAGWLTETGVLVADFELSSIRDENGLPAGRRLGNRLRSAGFSYDSRRHRITCSGRRTVSLPYAYLGADDHAGANYTGQPAVHSYYSEC